MKSQGIEVHKLLMLNCTSMCAQGMGLQKAMVLFSCIKLTIKPAGTGAWVTKQRSLASHTLFTLQGHLTFAGIPSNKTSL